jgi:ferredoxin-NADP reductase
MTFSLRFVGQQHEAENAESFVFEPGVALTFQAGQYLEYTLDHPDADDRGVTRHFTIAAAPAEGLVRLTTRVFAAPSTFKQALCSLTPGDTLQGDGPFGELVYPETDTPVVLIAGGIGITPFRSILAELAARKSRTRTTLLYSNRSSDILFRGFLDGLTLDWPELRVVYTITRPGSEWHGPTGRIDAEFIRRHVPDPSVPSFMVCGPTPLVEGMRKTLAQAGVDASRIKDEDFPGYGSG